MKNYILRDIKVALFFLSLLSLISCDYKELGAADYSEQKIYMPASTADVGESGTYLVNSIATPGQNFRYVANREQNKLNIPLSVVRSGISPDGLVNVAIRTTTDTVTRLINRGVLPGAEVLPADKFTIEPAVTIASGKDVALFALAVDLNFLLANTSKTYAIAVSVSSEDVVSFEKFSTTVVVISPAFLVPAAAFNTVINGKMASFNNLSANSVSYTWNFGDGSPAITTTSPSYTYTAAGTYTVTLTATGALGDVNKSVKTASIIIP